MGDLSENEIVMADSGFEQVEHTADLALRVWAPDMRGLIEQAARGLVRLLLPDGAPPPERTIELRVEGSSPEELLHDALDEVLLLAPLEGLVPVGVEVTAADQRAATLQVGVVPLRARPGLDLQEIKAVTYHGLEIVSTERGLEALVVFDV